MRSALVLIRVHICNRGYVGVMEGTCGLGLIWPRVDNLKGSKNGTPQSDPTSTLGKLGDY